MHTVHQRMTRDNIANFHANRDPMHAAICGDEEVDDHSSITSHSVMAQEKECLLDASTVQSVCSGRRPQDWSESHTYKDCSSGLRGRPMVDETGRQMQRSELQDRQPTRLSSLFNQKKLQ